MAERRTFKNKLFSVGIARKDNRRLKDVMKREDYCVCKKRTNLIFK